jgi:hypothetical protein
MRWFKLLITTKSSGVPIEHKTAKRVATTDPTKLDCYFMIQMSSQESDKQVCRFNGKGRC